MESCSAIRKEGKAWKHFVHSFKTREIYKLIDLEELERRILISIKEGKSYLDEKHKGLKGPRYRIYVDVGSSKIIVVVVEKTEERILPITIWPESLS